MRKLTKKMKTRSSTIFFFLSESEEESCKGVAEAAAAAMADMTRKEKATREWGLACNESEERTYSNY
jgi:hypothetical protein